MLKSTYDTANRGYVDRAVLADTATTATTAGTITGQGDAATKNVGTTAGTVAAGNDSRLPSTDQKAALGGTSGTPSASNPYATKATTDAEASALSAHTARTDNPHGVTKAQVGLGSCDNTADASKPVSTAQQAAIDAAYANVDAVAGPFAAPAFPVPLDTIITVQNFHDLYLKPFPEGTGAKASAAHSSSRTEPERPVHVWGSGGKKAPVRLENLLANPAFPA